jgi:hypothetical protein
MLVLLIILDLRRSPLARGAIKLNFNTSVVHTHICWDWMSLGGRTGFKFISKSSSFCKVLADLTTFSNPLVVHYACKYNNYHCIVQEVVRAHKYLTNSRPNISASKDTYLCNDGVHDIGNHGRQSAYISESNHKVN